MRLHILSIGRLKQGPELALCRDYETRIEGLGRQAGLTRLAIQEFAESRQATAAGRQDEETTLLQEALPPKAFAVVLDERGKSLSSEAFAGLIRSRADAGAQDMAFLIGGPDGHAAKLREEAGLMLSLSAMTWPHRLVRLMLLEQIYRSVTILVNHPYHRP